MHPKELLYSTNHVWCRKEADGNVRLGMTYYLQEKLRKIVYLEYPSTGSTIAKGDALISFESSKTASDLISPISGTVVESNTKSSQNPQLVHNAPYQEGWMLLLKPNQPAELDALLSADDYENLTQE
ncbi:MAG: glycine cleavage system protein GcvH [Dehalococcoidia bacterium]|nr:glycine cleavage system protein GcvH [Dehalococcoidia bacterium]